MSSAPSTKFKEHLVLSREEIAERLRHLADQIAQGTVSLGSAQAALPTQAKYEVEFEVDPDRHKLEIELEWR